MIVAPKAVDATVGPYYALVDGEGKLVSGPSDNHSLKYEASKRGLKCIVWDAIEVKLTDARVECDFTDFECGTIDKASLVRLLSEAQDWFRNPGRQPADATMSHFGISTDFSLRDPRDCLTLSFGFGVANLRRKSPFGMTIGVQNAEVFQAACCEVFGCEVGALGPWGYAGPDISARQWGEWISVSIPNQRVDHRLHKFVDNAAQAFHGKRGYEPAVKAPGGWK